MTQVEVAGVSVTAEQLQFVNAFFIVTLTPVVRFVLNRPVAPSPRSDAPRSWRGRRELRQG